MMKNRVMCNIRLCSSADLVALDVFFLHICYFLKRMVKKVQSGSVPSLYKLSIRTSADPSIDGR